MTWNLLCTDKRCYDQHFLFYDLKQIDYGLKDIQFLLLAPLYPLLKGPVPFSGCYMKGRQKLYHFCSTCYHNIYVKSYRWKAANKSDAFSNSIFEPYRAPALLKLKTWDSIGINFSPWKFEEDILSSLEIISSQNDTLKIRKSSSS